MSKLKSVAGVIVYKDKGLENLIKALDDETTPRAHVGILGDKTTRTDEGPNNASIGLKHEFGDQDNVRRSFLRVPITDNLQSYLDKAGAFDKDMFKKVLATGSFAEYVKKIGLIGVNIVLDAFDTGGFGKWKPSVMWMKKNHQTLVETQQLRNSIVSEVTE